MLVFTQGTSVLTNHCTPQFWTLWLLLLSSKILAHLCSSGLSFSEIEKGSGSWGVQWRKRVLGWGWTSGCGFRTPVCPEWFLRHRGSTQIRAGIEMKCSTSCTASKQGQSTRVHLNSCVPPYTPMLLLNWRAKENPANMSNSDSCHWMDFDGKRCLECCMIGHLIYLTERTSLV